MRLWHEHLIPFLDSNRLVDLHRTICGMRGLGWGKKNKNIDWVYKEEDGENKLTAYHWKVLLEMDRRGFHFDVRWLSPDYCGERREPRDNVKKMSLCVYMQRSTPIFDKHDDNLLLVDAKDLEDRGAPVRVLQNHYANDGDVHHIYTITSIRLTSNELVVIQED